jgi:putative PEP-CTERM system TPR-repeat lipoprotein
MLTSSTSLRAAVVVALAVLSGGCSSPEAQKQRHFEQGNAYAAQKRDDFAVIEYANAVRIDPKFGEARLKLAETYERMGNVQAAFPEFVRAADALPDNRDLQLKVTQLLLLAQRFEDAKARATSMLAKNPKDVQAVIARANAMAALKDVSGAMTEIEEAQKIAPNDVSVFVSRGAIQQQSGAAKEAEAAYRQAVTLDPSAVNAHLALANFLLTTGRYSEAEQQIKQGIAVEPKNVLANRLLASLYVATNRRQEAEQPIKVIAESSKVPGPKFELADYYASVGRDDEAKKLLTTLAADPASLPRAEGMIAAIDYQRGKTREAHARLDKLLERAPKDSPALVMKARWLTNEQKPAEALDRAKAAVAADPQSAMAQYTLGVVQSLLGNIPEAITAYTDALRLNPRFTSAQIQLARVNLLRGDRDAALRYAQEAKQSAPGSIDARVALARSYLQRGDLEHADTEIKELLKQWPDVAEVQTLNGTLQAMRNNHPAARAALTRALELAPDNLDALGGLIAIDVKEKRLNEAAKRIDAEVARRPDLAPLLALAGGVYDQAGQKDKAEQVLRRAIAADSKSMGAYLMLAQFYIRQGRLDEARKEFETVIKQDPRSWGARTMIGIILETQGKREEARRAYEAAVAENASNAPVAANNLAYIYAEDGSNLDVALNLAGSAKKAMPDNPEVDDTLGWVYYKKDLPTVAVASLEESVKKKPGSGTTLYHLGMAYAKAGGRDAQARDALERALKLNLQPADAAAAKQVLSTLSR